MNDGHTGVYRPAIELSQTKDKGDGETYLPERNSLFEEGQLQFTEIENKIVVSIISNNLAEKLPLGSILLEVNNIPVEEYMREYIYPYISQSAEHIKRIYAVNSITRGRLYGDKLSIKARSPEGKEVLLSLTSGGSAFYPQEEMQRLDLAPSTDWKLLELNWLENDIALLTLNSFGDNSLPDKFKEILPELRRAKGLIIDIRNNGGGSTNNGTAILEYLVTGDNLIGSKSRTRQNLPAYKAWGTFIKEKDTINNARNKKAYLAARDLLYFDLNDAHEFRVKPSIDQRIIVPTAILTSNWTASAAEDFLIYADKQKHMVKIGEKTFGSTGQPLSVELVGGFGAFICTKHDMYADGREFVGVGVIPDIEVKPTLKDYFERNDVVLNTAVAHLKKQIQ